MPTRNIYTFSDFQVDEQQRRQAAPSNAASHGHRLSDPDQSVPQPTQEGFDRSGRVNNGNSNHIELPRNPKSLIESFKVQDGSGNIILSPDGDQSRTSFDHSFVAEGSGNTIITSGSNWPGRDQSLANVMAYREDVLRAQEAARRNFHPQRQQTAPDAYFRPSAPDAWRNYHRQRQQTAPDTYPWSGAPEARGQDHRLQQPQTTPTPYYISPSQYPTPKPPQKMDGSRNASKDGTQNDGRGSDTYY